MQKDHGVVQDERGQDQPKDKKTAQKLGVKKENRAGAKYTQEQPTEKGARKGRNLPPNEREGEDVRAQPGQDPVKKKAGEF